MRLRVGLLQSFDCDVGVNLCSRETRVPEQCLHAAQVRAAIEHVSGKAVTKFVRTDRYWN